MMILRIVLPILISPILTLCIYYFFQFGLTVSVALSTMLVSVVNYYCNRSVWELWKETKK